jgi:type I site-specific restriction endonuclease
MGAVRAHHPRGDVPPLAPAEEREEAMTDLMRVIEQALGGIHGLIDYDDVWRSVDADGTRENILAALRPAVEQWMTEKQPTISVTAPLDEAAERERFERDTILIQQEDIDELHQLVHDLRDERDRKHVEWRRSLAKAISELESAEENYDKARGALRVSHTAIVGCESLIAGELGRDWADQYAADYEAVQHAKEAISMVFLSAARSADK